MALTDLLTDVASAVYAYFDPDLRARGLGVNSVLAQLAHARSLRLRYLYLGYWIAPCASMAYKNQYRPHQLLQAYVPDGHEPVWREPGPRNTATEGAGG